MIKDQRIEIESPLGPHFVGNWSALDADLCRELIGFFEDNPQLQKSGRIGGQVDTEARWSTDISIEPISLENASHAVFHRYFGVLHECFRDYCEQWDFLKSFVNKTHVGTFKLQKYEVGGHFAKLHSEKTSFRGLPRILVWMTYLNDIEDGGETEFTHYDLKIKPEAGKTLIWPAEWTHAHRGCPTLSGAKYIVTGWFQMTPSQITT